MRAHFKAWLEAFEGTTSKRSYFAAYTIVFLILFFAMSFSFLFAGKGFIWNVDGLEQQYVFFAYEGEWLRELLYNIFVARTGVVPVWSLEIGYGADVIMTLLPSLGDPLNLLSVLVPMEYADLALNASVPLHLYLAGLAFSGFCFYRAKDRFSVLVSSMVYVFSGYTLLAFSQIFMLYPLLLGPLVVWGIEKVLARESPLLFIGAMALCFLKSVTTAYAVCLLLVVYCLVRYAFLPERKHVGGFLKWLMKICGLILVAAMIGAVLFVPGVLTILGEGRLGLDRPEALLYPIGYYVKLVLGFGSLSDVGADCSYGFAAVALLAVFLLFGKGAAKTRGSSVAERRFLRVIFIVLTVFLCLPLIGKVFNGFAYPNNRWVWAYVLCVAYIVAAMLPDCLNMEKGRSAAAVKGSVAYAFVVAFVLFPFTTKEALFGVAMLLVLLVALAGTFCTLTGKTAAVLLSLLACVCFFYNGYGSQFVASGGNRVAGQVGLGRSHDVLVENNPTTLVSRTGDDSFWRYDSAEVVQYLNSNMVQRLKSPLFYDSYYNDLVDEYHTGLGLAASSINFMYAGLDSRTPLEALAGVKYFVTPDESDDLIPPLFDTTVFEGEAEGSIFRVSQTDSYLPLVFTYDKVIDRTVYDELDPSRKQQALLQGAVVESSSSPLEDANLVFTEERLGFKLESLDGTPIVAGGGKEDETGFSYDGERFTVYRADTRIVLDVQVPPDVDAYVAIAGLSYRDLLPSERLTGSERAETPLYRKQQLAFQDIVYGVGTVDAKVRLSLAGVEKTIWNPTNASHLYGGKDEWLVNMGYSNEPRQRIELIFQDPGVYSFDDLQVLAQPVDCYESQIQQLKDAGADKVADVRFDGSTLSCRVSIENDPRLVYFMVPFSKGWTAQVDGRPAELLQANVAFMGIELGEGVHEVVLHYETPGLKAGVVLTALGIVVCAVAMLARRRLFSSHTKRHMDLSATDKGAQQ